MSLCNSMPACYIYGLLTISVARCLTLDLLKPAEFQCEETRRELTRVETFCLNLLSPADCRFLSTYSAFRGSACGLLLGSDPQPLPPVPLQTPQEYATSIFRQVGSLATGAAASCAQRLPCWTRKGCAMAAGAVITPKLRCCVLVSSPSSTRKCCLRHNEPMHQGGAMQSI
jgi:hypothetical protein